MGKNYYPIEKNSVEYKDYINIQQDQIQFGEDSFKVEYVEEFNNNSHHEPIIRTPGKKKSKIDLDTSFVKIDDRLIKLILAFITIVLFPLFFHQIKSTFLLDSLNISGTTFTIISVYLIIFSMGLYLLTRKKRITIYIKENHLHLSSFPNFHKKFPLESVLSCHVNTFEHPDEQFEYFTTEIIGNYGKLNIELKSGLAVSLHDGRRFLFGTSESQNFNSLAYAQNY